MGKMTPRELVAATLRFGRPARVPRELWALPWAEENHGAALAGIRARYPDDIVRPPAVLRRPLKTSGDEYKPGVYIDEWGCRFENRQSGIIGEVKEPLLGDWKDWRSVRVPVERLTLDTARVDAFCRATDRFVLARPTVRPFEQLQFIRRPDNLYLDLADPPDELHRLLERIHGFFKEEMELWATTAVDGLFFADDWGSQNALLIAPALWRRLFRPLYEDYIAIARRRNKFIFMHSDGHIEAILSDLVEMGLDAVNAQLFCMDIEGLGRRLAGRLTFWGELDRQHLLPYGTPDDIRAAVRRVGRAVWRDGGAIAQCEFGIGARPENVAAVFEAWDEFVPGR